MVLNKSDMKYTIDMSNVQTNKPKFIYVKPKKSRAIIKSIIKEMAPALSSLAQK